ncbi:type VII secretion protein EccB [Mycobacterium sp. SM1]|uniref:type VII secretion protein EccB n=1 Tax=Mycobacterium sp. SM1 TaxID=2816243 RepID=UPI001BCA9096|nr:type VII secretion protein EccB [Mycobacterium sp. SM1]MBS4728331.1 type VII secretion protein EccB [Mycobacterium sp. SM1]
MTTPQPEGDRRSFASRTPTNNNPDKVVYRRGFVTRHQVSGWRFVMRRIASGVALHDTRMLVDPLRTQTRAVLVGMLILVTGLAGCFVFSLIRPTGTVGANPVLADRSTAALYVRVGEQLHPVLNLTSARLIVGRPVNPTVVKSNALDRFPRGNLLGIPGAPERMVQTTARDANWTVCDGVSGPATGITVIAGPTDSTGARAAPLGAGHGVLVDNGKGTWLLWDGKRSAINLADRAVTNALGWSAETPAPRPIAAGLLNAIPEAPPLSAPAIPDAGQPPRFGLPVPAPIGAVVVSYATDNTMLYYAVLPDGLQPISAVLAAMLRNTNSYGLQQPPRLGADQVARLPVSRLLDTTSYPNQRVSLVDAARNPLTCAQWSKPAGAAASSLALLTGSTLPVPEAVRTVDLVGGGAGGSAARVALPPGIGYFVQTAGQGPAAPAAGSPFWVADTGVRYGIDDTPDAVGHVKTVDALGLTPPALPIPWSMLSLFAPGPTLSRPDALVAHDALPADPRPGRPASALGASPASGRETR